MASQEQPQPQPAAQTEPQPEPVPEQPKNDIYEQIKTLTDE